MQQTIAPKLSSLIVDGDLAMGLFAVTGTYVGAFLSRTVYTSGSGNHTTGAKTRRIRVTCVGGGGTGGWCNVAGSGAGGGGGGGTAKKDFAVSPSTAYAYVVGIKGNHGTIGSPGTQPTDASASTFIVGGTTLSGGGGLHGVATDPAATYGAGGAGGAATNGDLNIGGAAGFYGTINAAALRGGQGGSSSLGGGALASAAAVGIAGALYGGGGSGSSATAQYGGDGASGCVIVEEYA